VYGHSARSAGLHRADLDRRAGITITGKGAGRTIVRSPTTRVKSTVTTTFLQRYSYVVEVKPGSLATLRDLTIDGRSNATCTERYFGVRYHNATGNLERVVVENVRGMGSSFSSSCTNIYAVGVTSEGSGGGSVQLTQSTVRNFQSVGVLASGSHIAGDGGAGGWLIFALTSTRFELLLWEGDLGEGVLWVRNNGNLKGRSQERRGNPRPVVEFRVSGAI